MAKDRDAFKFLILASAISIAFWFIPYLSFIVYPFRLFVTFIHEGGHALATLLTLGSVERIVIHQDGSGETYSRGGAQLLVASAGYLSSTLYGALLLIFCKRGQHVKPVLAATSAVILCLTVLYVSGIFGWLAGIAIATSLIFVTLVARPRAAHFFLSFLAVQCSLNALYDLRTLFLVSAYSNGPSDAVNMYRMTLIPPIVWAVTWLGVSLLTLFMALRSYRRG
jgi:hypothetical protein